MLLMDVMDGKQIKALQTGSSRSQRQSCGFKAGGRLSGDVSALTLICARLKAWRELCARVSIGAERSRSPAAATGIQIFLEQRDPHLEEVDLKHRTAQSHL